MILFRLRYRPVTTTAYRDSPSATVTRRYLPFPHRPSPSFTVLHRPSPSFTVHLRSSPFISVTLKNSDSIILVNGKIKINLALI